MTSQFSESDESQQHLEAMLYLLEDPILDCQAFEARLATDVRLAEILATAVLDFQRFKAVSRETRSVDFGYVSSVQENPTPLAKFDVNDLLRSPYKWSLLASFAASLLLIGSIGWRAFHTVDNSDVKIELPNEISLDRDQIVLAWSELQSDDSPSEELASSMVGDHESDLPAVLEELVEPPVEIDVPEWLILASADIIDTDNRKLKESFQ